MQQDKCWHLAHLATSDSELGSLDLKEEANTIDQYAHVDFEGVASEGGSYAMPNVELTGVRQRAAAGPE